jgi:hypothetical protein
LDILGADFDTDHRRFEVGHERVELVEIVAGTVRVEAVQRRDHQHLGRRRVQLRGH